MDGGAITKTGRRRRLSAVSICAAAVLCVVGVADGSSSKTCRGDQARCHVIAALAHLDTGRALQRTAAAGTPLFAVNSPDERHFEVDLSATVDPNGFDTTGVQLQWGTTTAYEQPPVNLPDVTVNAGPTLETAVLTTFAPSTMYHYRFVATNEAGTSDSGDNVFTSDAAVTFYVNDDFEDPTCEHDPDGSGPATAFCIDSFATVHEAIAQVGPGDTVDVLAGAYGTDGQENNLSINRQGVSLIGEGSDTTTIHTQALVLNAANSTIEGFSIVGPGHLDSETHHFTGSNGPLVRLGSGASHTIFANNAVSGGKRGLAVSLGDGSGPHADNSVISGNEFFGNLAAVVIDSSSDNAVVGNDIHDNGDNQSSPQASIIVNDNQDVNSSGNLILGNTIVNSGNHGITVFSSGNEIAGNTITNSGTTYPAFRESSGIELGGSDFGAATQNVVVGNVISGSAFAGIRVGGNGVDANTITGNTITGTLHGGAVGSGSDRGGAAILITQNGATNTTIVSNTLNGNDGYGIFLGDSDPTTANTQVHQNDIVGNRLAGIDNQDPSSVDANDNWWGSANGPSGPGFPGTGDAIIQGFPGNVTATTFLSSSHLTPPAPPTPPPAPPQFIPPVISGVAAGSITSTSASVGATIDPEGGPTRYTLDYGTTTAYDHHVGPVQLSSATAAQSVSQALSGLTEGTTYHFRFVATNDAGTTTGPDTTFTTAGPPAPGQPGGAPPPPETGKTVDVSVYSGTVLVNGVPLTDPSQIQVGSTIDTRNGTVTLETVGPTGAIQFAAFAGAVFVVQQQAGGVTVLQLQGGNFNTCTAKRHVAAKAPPKPVKKVVRDLWGNGQGQFQTKGRYAAATVRGTIWHIVDRCDGTLVFVERGVVAVQDLVRHKTVNVTAGHSYFAAKP